MRKYLLALVLLTPLYANAQELSYSFVQVTYFSSDLSDVDIDGDGVAFNASAALTDNLAFTFGYEDASFDFDIESTALTVGVDFHTSIARSTDLVLGVSYLDAEVSDPFVSFDDTGNVISGGVRSKVAPAVEVSASVARVDVFDASSTSFGASVLFGTAVQFGAGFSTSDDSDTFVVGVVANF